MKRAFKIIIPLLLVLVILIGAAWYFLFFRADDLTDFVYRRAQSAHEQGEYKEAIQLYSLANRLSEKNPSIVISMADAYADSGNFTKAEYNLVSMISTNPDDPQLYRALSRIYVEQGKLYDAEQMLNRISNEAVQSELEALRPSAPILSEVSGNYQTYLDLSVDFSEGTAYISTDGSYPTLSQPYDSAITLKEGTTEVYAVVVAANGLVSRAAYGSYTIGRVVGPAVFEDRVVEEWVRYILNLDAEAEITTDMLWQIQALYLPEGVQTFADLPYFENLSVLSVSGLRNADFSPLSKLKHLKCLNLEGCSLDTADLTSIGQITSLTELLIPNCGVSNISALENLTSLNTLDLSGNSITTVSVLGRLKALESLNLKGNAITDITELEKLTELSYLNLSDNLIADDSVLGGMTAMQELHLSGCGILDLDFAEKMPLLRYLDISGNRVDNIAVLRAAANLEYLDVSGNLLTSLEPLAELRNLAVLYADRNELTELPYFSKDSVLRLISANENQITDVAGVCDLYRLNYIYLDYNELTEIYYLGYCVNLVQVDVFANPVADAQVLLDSGIIVNYDPTYVPPEKPEDEDESSEDESTEASDTSEETEE